MSVSQLGSTNLIKDLQLWPEVRQSPPLVNIDKLNLASSVWGEGGEGGGGWAYLRDTMV